MSQVSAAGLAPPDPETGAPCREVRYEHSLNCAPILTHLSATLLISTYQAGKVVVVGVAEGKLAISLHNFERVMGLAVRPDRIAVGTRTQIWFCAAPRKVARRVPPAGQHDGCFLTRSSHFTGNVHIHELAWAGDELWFVNTLFSCLCTLHPDYSFVPRWRPPFISALAAQDRCHLNGLALAPDERGVFAPRYATALAETDTPEGWRPQKATGGCLIDVPSGAMVARGFAMPHSPRVWEGRVWLLDSGTGRLVTVDPASGQVEPVVELPGYARGLALAGTFAFVGLSKIRETSGFAGMPIARREGLKCGVAIVDLTTGRLVGHLEFQSGVEEIFDVQLLPGMRSPAPSGPFTVADGQEATWTVPEPSR